MKNCEKFDCEMELFYGECFCDNTICEKQSCMHYKDCDYCVTDCGLKDKEDR